MTSLDRMIPTLVHIQTHLDDDLKLEGLARLAGVTPSHFSRSFSAKVGESPRAYVERLRLERAAVLLVVRAASVLEIALDPGSTATRRSRGRSAGNSASLQAAGATAPGPTGPRWTPTTGVVDPWPTSFPKGRCRRRRSGRCALCPFCSSAMSARTTRYRPPLGVMCRLRPLAGGPFAITTYVGQYTGLAEAYRAIVERIVARTPRVELVGLPAIESYHTTVINPETSLNETEIALPVRISGVGQPPMREEQ